MSVPSCLGTMQWSTPPDQLPLSSLQEVSAFLFPHPIQRKTPSAVATGLPCRWQPPRVKSVNSSLTVLHSTFVFIGVDSQQRVGLPRLFRAFNDSCPLASAPSLHQPLLPPYKISPHKSGQIMPGSTQARSKRRSTHVPNQTQYGSTLEPLWSDD